MITLPDRRTGTWRDSSSDAPSWEALNWSGSAIVLVMIAGSGMESVKSVMGSHQRRIWRQP